MPDGQSGQCLAIVDCSSVQQQVEQQPKPLSLQFAEYLRRLHCGGFEHGLVRINVLNKKYKHQNHMN